MSSETTCKLSPAYTAEFDHADEHTWYELLKEFEDANIYQTWAYASVVGGQRNISQMVLRNDGRVVAIALARIAKVPLLKAGIAYVMWGPLWRPKGVEASAGNLRQAIRALRIEYVGKRGLVLRLFPLLFDDDTAANFSLMLKEEGFLLAGHHVRSRTLLMDLTLSLADLHANLRRHWARELKRAGKKDLEIIQGSSDKLFEQFVSIYREMVSRKHFIEPNDILQFRRLHSQLPANLKMNILLCREGADVSAGLVCSAIGNSAVLLFAATSNRGMKTGGSYVLQWRLIEELQQRKTVVFNLNGINPSANPGTYQFKAGLAGASGRDVYFLGRFDSDAPVLSRLCVSSAERVKAVWRKVMKLASLSHTARIPARVAQ